MSDCCGVCEEIYTKKIRSKVECPNPGCDFECCRKCVITTLESSPSTFVYCMTCKTRWNSDKTDSLLTKKAKKQLYENKKNESLEYMKREAQRVMLGGWGMLMEYSDRYVLMGPKEFDKLQSKSDKKLINLRSNYQNRPVEPAGGMRLPVLYVICFFLRRYKNYHMWQYTIRHRNKSNTTLLSFILKIVNDLDTGKVTEDDLVEIVDNPDPDVDPVYHKASSSQNADSQIVPVKEHDPISNTKNICHPCSKEGCVGLVFEDKKKNKNNPRKCVVCSSIHCSKCGVVKKEDNHECKEEDRLTYEEINKNSKPCPDCGARIHKSSGCSQMYCVLCKTVFDYNTGKKEDKSKGFIHNPHYLDEVRNERLGNIDGGGHNEAGRAIIAPNGFLNRVRYAEREDACQPDLTVYVVRVFTISINEAMSKMSPASRKRVEVMSRPEYRDIINNAHNLFPGVVRDRVQIVQLFNDMLIYYKDFYLYEHITTGDSECKYLKKYHKVVMAREIVIVFLEVLSTLCTKLEFLSNELIKESDESKVEEKVANIVRIIEEEEDEWVKIVNNFIIATSSVIHRKNKNDGGLFVCICRIMAMRAQFPLNPSSIVY